MSAVDLGNDLLEAKAFVGHRNFLPWLRTEFQWSERKARYYMRIALHFDGKVAKFADLDLDTANTLIAKSTPDEVRDQLFARAEAKQPITRAEVKTAIAGGKAARRMAGAAARQAGSSEAKSGSAIAEDPETVNDDGETADDARSTAKKSPTEEIALALVWLNWNVAKSRLRCDADEIATLVLQHDKFEPTTMQKSFEPIDQVKSALSGLQDGASSGNSS